jgi:predicted CoA-binding protein
MVTLIVGASTNPDRYAYKAAKLLADHGFDFRLIGIKEGEILGQSILPIKRLPKVTGIDVVTLYIGPNNQTDYIDYIIDVIKPSKVIFNPGTENELFYSKLKQANISYEEACTLVLLQTGQYA